MGKIQQLDAQTANRIAAGEVVERPMGVVKELVENSIDAGSTRIVVRALEGGTKLIRVEDNGFGMDADDVLAAFQRHATSKIHNSNDLWQIRTLGFRGEALPSIASVAKVELISNDGNQGNFVKIHYGEMVDHGPIAYNQGTSIQVEGLFYQTPARLKHLRSGAYENSLIVDVIGKFALSHPEISFTYYSDDKEVFRTTGQGDLKEVLYQLYGRQAAEDAIAVSFSDDDYQVTGYIDKPSITRASRNYIHIFLNGRMVRTYHLYQAVMNGYEDFIVKGRYPLVALHVTMDTQLIDVNVHPSKWEVRISKEKQLEVLIQDGIRRTLMQTNLAPQAEAAIVKPTYAEELSMDIDSVIPVKQPTMHVEEPMVSTPVQAPAPTMKEETKSFPSMEVIGQLHDKFILCACVQGLAVIDQHAAQERVHYEEICACLNQKPAMSECLVPIALKTTSDMVARIDEVNASCQELHITFEPFGHDTLLIREVPLWMKDIEEETFLQDLLDNFAQEKQNVYAKLEKKKIATMACHRSIRFHRHLTMQEMQEVVAQLSRCENPYHCPHGRPTFVILEEKILTKEFYR